MPEPAHGPPADPPGEAGVWPALDCAACGRAETRGSTLVCDGCERGFHVGCASVGERQLDSSVDWVCGDCALGGCRSKRWEVGKVCAWKGIGVPMLDMNSLPPADAEADGGVMEEASCKANGNRQFRHSDLVCIENGVYLQDSSIANRKVRGSHSSHQKGFSSLRGFENGILGSSLGAFPLANSMPLLTSSQLEQDSFLQSLKEFFSEKHGSPGEGWLAELKQPNKFDSGAVYRMSDGRRLDSMFNVSNDLQTMPNVCYATIHENGEVPGSVHRTLTRRRRRKELARLVGSNNHAENNQESAKNSCILEASENENRQFCNINGVGTVAEPNMDDIAGSRYYHPDVRLPVKCEDFYVISFGKIDVRLSYHNSSQIWPVGYQSCWHDRVTGSIFKCEVSDGGDLGPLFRVKRYPCSSLPLPVGETVLTTAIPEKMDVTQVDRDAFSTDLVDDEDDEIRLMLADPSVVEPELFSIFNKSNQVAGSCASEICEDHLSVQVGIDDEIGEFLVEGRSTGTVWGLVAKAFVVAYHDAYKKSHILHFRCKHVTDAPLLDCHGLLAKYSCVTGLELSQPARSESDLEGLCVAITNWLNQDRFGLDLDFVQEFIEKIPGAQMCAQYEFLSNRSLYSTSLTVGNGMLLAKYRTAECGSGEFISYSPSKEPDKLELPDQSAEPFLVDCLPPCGRPFQSRIPTELVGDVIQIWEMFGRFYEILGLQKPISLEELEEELIDPWSYSYRSNFSEKEVLEQRDPVSQGTEITRSPSGLSATESHSSIPPESAFIQVETDSVKEAAHVKLASLSYGRCTGVALTKAHISLLKVLVGELQCRVAVFADPSFDGVEPKPRRGRKKEAEYSVSMKKSKISMLTLNELTWPELARRYLLAVSAMDFNPDSVEICSREGSKVFRCLQGDGGILCGSLAGVAGMKADALLLAEAGKQIPVPIEYENLYFPVEWDELEEVNTSDTVLESGGILPEWAQVLEPVRKLPTNVGTRIRKCIYESLERNPPEWARKILEHSISKEVYKGNASGPTKKAVLSVLAEVSGETVQQKPKERKEKRKESLSTLIMKQCRVILRRAMGADEAKVFCNLLGTALLNSNENDEEGILGSPGQISRPLDFRTIDLRLAVGAYGEHHKAFIEDVRELWHNIRTVYGDRPDLIELAESLSQNFEELYETEVLHLIRDFTEGSRTEGLSTEMQKKFNDLLSAANDMPKAPWEDGVCKVCGIDKDDDSVLLCDTCDSEYHTYCLIPPLSKIPAGNWYCPSCVASQSVIQLSSPRTEARKYAGKQSMGEESKNITEYLHHLALSLEEKQYWELSIEERIFLLKFLSDEVLNSHVIRENIDHCTDISSDLQTKLRALAVEWRDLKSKETILRTKIESCSKIVGIVDDVREESIAPISEILGITMQQKSSGQQRWSSVSLESEENGFSSSADKNLNQRILRSMRDRNANGSISQSNSHGVPRMKDFSREMSNNIGSSENNVTLQENLLSTLNTIKEGSQLSDEFYRASKRQKTDGNLKPSECTETMHMDKCDFFVSISKNVVEPIKLPVVGDEHLDVVNTTPLMNFTQDNCNAPEDREDLQTCKEALDSLKNEISLLQETVVNLESQIFMASLRRDFIGRDSLGRIFWSLGKPGKHPWLLVDGTIRVTLKGQAKQKCALESTANGPPVFSFLNSRQLDAVSYSSHFCMESLSPWMIYESDKDIQQLINWLRDGDVRERDLKDCILQWQRLRSCQSWNHFSDDFQMDPKIEKDELNSPFQHLHSQASILLEKKYGPFHVMEANDIRRKRGKKTRSNQETRMYRCECLEPVWPARLHCVLCHQTFPSTEELEGHSDGKCIPNPSGIEENKESDSSIRGKGTKAEGPAEKDHFYREGAFEVSKHMNSDTSTTAKALKRSCPHDFEEICLTFVTKNSNKELVREIGLIGTNGLPCLIESPPMYLNDSFEMVNVGQGNMPIVGTGITSSHKTSAASTKDIMLASVNHIACVKSSLKVADNVGLELAIGRACVLENASSSREHASHSNQTSKQDGNPSFTIPGSALRPLSGKVAQILKKLKSNLLDMDAALPEEALRPLMTSSRKRCRWRTFVKSADSIYEMVQASILLEGMIRSEYLKNERWYWSSFTAAARTSTISSLALWIFSLDASIIYSKSSRTEPVISTDNPKTSNRPLKRRKDMDGGT